MKAEVDKLDINKLVNVPTGFNNLKTKVNDLDVGKLKTVPIGLKKLIDLVDNEVAKNTKSNILKAHWLNFRTRLGFKQYVVILTKRAISPNKKKNGFI